VIDRARNGPGSAARLHCRTAVPARWRPWLLDSGSLTERLRAASGGDLRVRVLSQRWARPRLEERRALRLGAGQRALIREVLLLGRGEPWIHARSVLPLGLLRGRYRFLAQLGERPLGALLFRDPTLRRGPIQVERRPVPALPGLELPPGALAWERRSLFHLAERPLLVAEMFLPGFKP
jgi:chorismate lyase